MSIQSRLLPKDALLQRYGKQWEQPGAAPYTDCFHTWIPQSVSLEQFVGAFYTTWLFRLERWVIARAARRPSTDQQAAELAAGQREDFAVWTVEARTADQLLLTDLSGRTRSWLMLTDSADGQPAGSILWFGSAVLPVVDARTGESSLGWGFTLLLGFHKIYSRALLAAAARRLKSRS